MLDERRFVFPTLMKERFVWVGYNHIAVELLHDVRQNGRDGARSSRKTGRWAN